MKYDYKKDGLGRFISNSLYVSSTEIEKDVYEGSLKGITCKVKFQDDIVFVSNYCVKCGNEFFYLYDKGKPKTVCDTCNTVNKIPEVVGEVEINGKLFLKYSNGVIRPK